MARPNNPDRFAELIQFILVLLGMFLSVVGWLRWARLA
jgi:uncharacterized membrane protein YidH (DUF202 family)